MSGKFTAALLRRINERISRDGLKLVQSNDGPGAFEDLGRFYLIDLEDETPYKTDVDPLEVAEQLYMPLAAAEIRQYTVEAGGDLRLLDELDEISRELDRRGSRDFIRKRARGKTADLVRWERANPDIMQRLAEVLHRFEGARLPGFNPMQVTVSYLVSDH